MNTATLSLHELSVGYHARRFATAFALTEIEVAVHPGELVCLLGPNGSGKSTLLRTVAGFQSPLAGRILYDGRPAGDFDVNARARFVSVVLTEQVDSGMLDARELVSLGRYPYTGWSGRLAAEDRRVVEWALEIVGASALAARSVMSLSDGERQKIMIARALAQQPRLIVLDEPTAYLDLPRKVEIMKLLGSLARDSGCSVLLSTHEVEIAQTLADFLWLIRPGGAQEGGERRDESIGRGTLTSGAPEDLVLSGDFERLFSANGVQFDRHLGRFQFGELPERRAILRGSGIAREWTERALRRAGIRAVEGAARSADGRDLPEVAVLSRGGRRLWRLRVHGLTRSFGSISDLLAAIRETQDDSPSKP